MLEKIDDTNNKSTVFGRDFHLLFEAKLEAPGGNPVMKRKYLAKLIQKKILICVIFGELETQTRSVLLFVNNILLVIFKEDMITFSYLMFYKNLQKNLMF